MSIGTTRLPRRGLVALAALAASVALLGTSAVPASADWNEDRTLSMPNHDVDIGEHW
jgi:hypothetical protein